MEPRQGREAVQHTCLRVKGTWAPALSIPEGCMVGGRGAASALQESDFPGSHCSEGWRWEVYTLGKDDFLAVSLLKWRHQACTASLPWLSVEADSP